jgi:hypothetical protein
MFIFLVPVELKMERNSIFHLTMSDSFSYEKQTLNKTKYDQPN